MVRKFLRGGLDFSLWVNLFMVIFISLAADYLPNARLFIMPNNF